MIRWPTCMRTIRRNTAVKRDHKREKKGGFGKTLDTDLRPILTALVSNQALPWRHHNHALVGLWKDHCDWHVRPDLILVYRKPDAGHLDPVRLGSHGELCL